MLLDIQDPSQVKLWKFPGGEVGVALEPGIVEFLSVFSPKVEIITTLNNSDEVMQLLMVVDALKRFAPKSISLTCSYFPYARQDRVCNTGEALAVKVIAQLINSLNFERVSIFDPHSDVTPALIDRVKVTDCTWLAERINRHAPLKPGYILVAPDLGATKKTQKIARTLNYNGDILQFEKTRNLATGEITGIKATTDFNCTKKHFIIFDDICDGGRTFIEIATKLKECGASTVALAVSHGIFSKGLACLYDNGIDQIFTTDSFKRLSGGDLTKSEFRQFRLSID